MINGPNKNGLFGSGLSWKVGSSKWACLHVNCLVVIMKKGRHMVINLCLFTHILLFISKKGYSFTKTGFKIIYFRLNMGKFSLGFIFDGQYIKPEDLAKEGGSMDTIF